MNVLLDSNVVLDHVLKRVPFADNATDIISLAKQGKFSAFVSASAVTDIYYIASKELKSQILALEELKCLLQIVGIAAVTGVEIRRAVDLAWPDFEDCVQFAAGENIQALYIITRDTDGFSASIIPAVSPEKFIDMITVD
jgi:predicted nucleic acid-binding protein